MVKSEINNLLITLFSLKIGMKLELVDKMRICQVRVATIKEITGRRLYLQYDEVDHDDNVFW